MLWVPQKGVVRHGSSGIVQVTTGASSGTKGSVVELIASTSFDAYWVLVYVRNYANAGSASEGAMDILIGAATESILIPDLLVGYCGASTNGFAGKSWLFPLYVPAGSRLSARAAGARTSTNIATRINLYGGLGLPQTRVGTRVTTYGVSVPNGTTITPGESSAEGSWAQIVASTSEDHFCFVPSFQLQADSTINNRAYEVEIGIGAATEEAIGPDFIFGTDSSENMFGPANQFPVFAEVLVGTRLVMRASNSSTNDGGYGGAIHAVS